MDFEAKTNRRLILRNSALVIGGLFVSGKIIAQTMPSAAPGAPTNSNSPNGMQQPTSPTTNPNQPGQMGTPQGQTGNTGLYQQSYSTGAYAGGFYGTSSYSTSTYGGGYYGTGYR